MTHDDLCLMAFQWLRKAGRCAFAVREPSIYVNAVSEKPDAFGFQLYHTSILIECKASRSGGR